MRCTSIEGAFRGHGPKQMGGRLRTRLGARVLEKTHAAFNLNHGQLKASLQTSWRASQQ